MTTLGEQSAPADHTRSKLADADRDLVAIGIVVAAIILFVGTGGNVFPRVIGSVFGVESNPEPLLVNALLLNVALIIFGWRRYSQLISEIDERRKAEEAASRLAHTDALTDCLNRRSIDGVISDMAESHADVVCILIDLDDFKKINDTLGHAAGDAVLVAMSERLKTEAPRGSVIARLGGDEFALVYPLLDADCFDMDAHAAQLQTRLSQPVIADKLPIKVSASIGVARFSQLEKIQPGCAQMGVGDRLLQSADMAMYAAKHAGGNRMSWFDKRFAEAKQTRADLEVALRIGLDKQEFVPYFEQQIDLQTGELVGFEMLARWHSETAGLVSPEVFIPIAEDIGIIGELSDQLVRQALQDARNWPPQLTLAINISAIQLRDPWFSQKLLKLLVESGFAANRLEIEVTESCLHEDLDMARSTIASLKNLGVVITLDDFGTGYSSLVQLQSLPFDRIKIDRSFVQNAETSAESRTIISSIHALGSGLGMPITAEGIESENVREVLNALGNFKGQGYLYGQPETAAQLRERFAAAAQAAVVPQTAPRRKRA